MGEHLYRVTAGHFVAGFVASEGGTVVRAAPILKRLRGLPVGKAVAECLRRKWGVEYVRGENGRGLQGHR